MARKMHEDDDDAAETPEVAAPVAATGRSRSYQTRGLIKTGHGMIPPGTPITASDVASEAEFRQMVKDGHIVPLVYMPAEA